MLNALQRRLQEGRQEDGFTLIELMVVVLIIAILIAIAIPTFLGARSRAQDRAAQSSLRNTLAAAKTIFTDKETYEGILPADLKSAEPSLDFDAADEPSADQNHVSISPDGTVFTAAALSASGTCFMVKDDTASGTTYGKFTADDDCSADQNPAGGFSAAGWQ
jgi:type IV pilus assembly protein PilA